MIQNTAQAIRIDIWTSLLELELLYRAHVYAVKFLNTIVLIVEGPGSMSILLKSIRKR